MEHHHEPVDHHETLRVPASWWLLGGIFALAVWWACFVALPGLFALAFGLPTLGAVVASLWTYGSVEVIATDDGLRAGSALLPWQYVGPVAALDSAQTRRQLGPDADARAFLLVRSYCPESVRITVRDPADPAPYWLVSTRHSATLVSSLARHRVRD